MQDAISIINNTFPLPRHPHTFVLAFNGVEIAITTLWTISSRQLWTLTSAYLEALPSYRDAMDTAYLLSTEKALSHFLVDEQQGLSEHQVQNSLRKYGRNGTVHHHISKL